MKIKKFLAPNMSEAMKQIRVELGDNAVILNSKVVQQKGFLGLVKKRKIEVIAAIDPEVKGNANVVKKRKEEPVQFQLPKVEKEKNVPNQENIHHELTELKKVVHHLSKFSNLEYHQFPGSIQSFLRKLSDQEVDQNIIMNVGDHLYEKWKLSEHEPSIALLNKWGETFLINNISSYSFGSTTKKYVNLVGPTGVGKTTTLAKMAAEAVLEKKKKIAFITTDTYRIAAIEQLKTYATLLNVPVEVVYKQSDFQKAIEKFIDFDCIFIDTAGRNYREIQYIEELKNLIDFEEDIETLLTLSLTMKENDMIEIVDSFQNINVDKFLFTKIDETKTYGSMLNLMLKYQVGIAYITTGQNVPDDIVQTTPEVAIQYLFGEIRNERPS